MSYVIYALFQMPGAAEDALRDLSAAGIPEDDYQVFVRKYRLTSDLRASEYDGTQGLLVGIAAGVLVGALLGWILAGPMGVLRLSIGPAVCFGMFVGLICGALGGGLYGTGLVHHNLQRLVELFRPGSTLVTAEIKSLPSRDAVDKIFRLHGAIETSR